MHTISIGFDLDCNVICHGKFTGDGCEVVGLSEVKGTGTAVDNEDTSASESLRTSSAAAAMTRLLLVPAVVLLHMVDFKSLLRHTWGLYTHPGDGLQSLLRFVLFGLTRLRGFGCAHIVR